MTKKENVQNVINHGHVKNIKNSNSMFDNYFEMPEIVYNTHSLMKTFNANNEEWAIYGNDPTKSLHTKYADDIKNITDQFNNDIIENIKFFKTLSNGSVSPHTDKRNVAINIPICIDDNMYVTFYEKNEAEIVGAPALNYNNENLQTSAKKYNPSTVNEIFYIKHATCIRTDVPHSVTNNSAKDRILLSISVKEKYDNYNVLKDLYRSGNLLNVYI